MNTIKLKVLYDNIVDYRKLEFQLNEMLKNGYVLTNIGFGNLGVFKASDDIDFTYLVDYRKINLNRQEFYDDFNITLVTTLNDVSIYQSNTETVMFTDEDVDRTDFKRLIKKQFSKSLNALIPFSLLLFFIKSYFNIDVLSSNYRLIQSLQILLYGLTAILDVVSKSKVSLLLNSKLGSFLRKYASITNFIVSSILILTIMINFKTIPHIIISILAIILVLSYSANVFITKHHENNHDTLGIVFLTILIASLILNVTSFKPSSQHFNSYDDIDYTKIPHESSILLEHQHFTFDLTKDSTIFVQYYQIKNTPFKRYVLKAIDDDNSDISSINGNQELIHDYDSQFFSKDGVHLLKEENSIMITYGDVNEDTLKLLFQNLKKRR